ncbi:MAG: AAA family ATPase [Deltaproteobacteria bacterium]|nr:AAA family ATPase [Deltaproteobacteria bacterium]
MPRSPASTLDADVVARLLATGDDAPSLDEQVMLAALLRARTRDAGGQLDRLLLEQLAALRQGLAAADHVQRELRAVLDRLAAPPWHPALFLRVVATDLGPRAMVAQAGSRRVVALGEDVAIDELAPGEEVLLGADGSIVAARSPYGAPPFGETATFERLLADGRVMLRWRDEEVVVDVAGALAATALAPGDLVRWDRTAWMALERVGAGTRDDLGFADVPDVGRADVGGLDDALELVLSALSATLVAPAKARAYGLRGRQAILMVGPPGCGKTLIARVAAAEVGRLAGRRCRFAIVKPSEWDDPYYGVTGQRIRATFAALARAADEDGSAVLFLDEIEAIGRARGGAGNLHGDKYLTALLVELDGFAAHRNVAVIAATNRRDLLDGALRSRFDVEVPVGRPTLAGARAIFALHVPPSVPLADGAGRDALVDLAVSRLYAPNAGAIATLVLRDGRTRVVAARELASGRLIAQIVAAACRRAYVRDLRGGAPGLRAADLEHAIDDALGRLATLLTPRNAHDHLVDLPADADVVRVRPCAAVATRPYRYERAA